MVLQRWSGAVLLALAVLLCIALAVRRALGYGRSPPGARHSPLDTSGSVEEWGDDSEDPIPELEEPEPKPELEPEPEPEPAVGTALVPFSGGRQAHVAMLSFTEHSREVQVSTEHDGDGDWVGRYSLVFAGRGAHSRGGVAVCRDGYAGESDEMMSGRGVFAAEFFLERGEAQGVVVGVMGSEMHAGAGRPPTATDLGWGYHLGDGSLWHDGEQDDSWVGRSHWAQQAGFVGSAAGDTLRLSVDMSRRTLTLHKNGQRLGVVATDVAAPPGEGLCWMVCLSAGVRNSPSLLCTLSCCSAPSNAYVLCAEAGGPATSLPIIFRALTPLVMQPTGAVFATSSSSRGQVMMDS